MLYKQSQTWASWGIWGTGRGDERRANAPNKPNSRQAGWDRASGTRAYCAKQSQFNPARPEMGARPGPADPAGESLCKTNPIRGVAARKTIVQARGLGDATPQGSCCAKQTQSGGAPWGTGNECAKQTQFPGGARWDAAWGRRGVGVVQTKPIPGLVPIRRSAFPGGQIVRNKANFGRGTGIPSAALSGQALRVSLDHRQDADATVPPGGGTTNLLETRWQLYQTNPIPGSAGWDGMGWGLRAWT
jgi:hypothetical protein